MYWDEGSHATPHFHAHHAGTRASVDLDGRIVAGDLDDTALRHVQEWATHLARNNQGKAPGEAGYVSPERMQIFLCFYYIMTGIHGIHLVVGIGCVLWLVQQAYALKIPRENYSTVEVVSLYWHLVDMIWLFLMPILYLAGAGLKTH